jgi:TPR repeat protein
MKRILVVALVFLLVTSTLTAGQRRSRVRAKRAALATTCDDLASHPNDPEATAKGVSDARLDASAVIKACEAETGVDQASPRLAFQLARGYLKAGRIEDAVEQLVTAAKGEHGGALAYLGDLYLDGAAGLEADPALAHTLYQRAVEAGFTPAKAILAQFEDFTDRDAATAEGATGSEQAGALPAGGNANKKYINPEIVENILQGELDAVPFGELYTKAYLVNMAENISEVCEDHFSKRDLNALKLDTVEKSVEMTPQAGLTTLLGLLQNMAQMTQNPEVFVRQHAQAALDQDQLPEEAMKDAFALMSRYSCGSRELSRFSKNLVSYVRNEGAPRMSTDEMYARCQREARPTGRYDAQNFCMCFVSAMSQTGVSRANRKGLSSDFWGTAQRMMAEKPGPYAMCTR